MLHVSHPEVRKVIDECEMEVRKLTGNPSITISLIDPTPPGLILDFDQLFDICCDAVGVQKRHVLIRSRKTERVTARQLTCYYARKHTKLCLREIGEQLGYIDHTTVIHGAQAIKDYIDARDERVVTYVNRINRAINQLATK
jgi:chromosomal replication initiation ATPase DnaA